MKKKIVIAIIVPALLLAGSYLCVQGYRSCKAYIHKRVILEKRKAGWNALRTALAKRIKSFDGVVALVIKDFDTGLEITFNKDRPLPSASMVKVPVMAACFYAEADGKLRLSETISLKNSHKVSGSGTLKNEMPGEEYSIEELIGLMVSESDNTAANMLIERLGTDYLNDCFKRMGLENTNLSRKMMDFKSRRKGIENYATAKDTAFLLEKMYYGRLLNATVSGKCLQVLAYQKVNDRIPKKLPAGTVVAHKTGLENGICHDAGIVYTPKGDFLICVLTKHGYKNARQAKKLIADISSAVYHYYMNS